jgi:hypothetical protein
MLQQRIAFPQDRKRRGAVRRMTPSSDLYRFHGRRLRVCSSSAAPLRYLRTLYRRFLDSDGACDNDARDAAANTTSILIDDRLGDRNLLKISYEAWELELRSVGEEFRLNCELPGESQATEGRFPSLYSFYQALMISAVGTSLRETHAIVHAASMSWAGEGIIFPGRAGAGKTTLSVALAQRGFGFLSDEIACYDLRKRRLEPHPRSVRLRAEAAALLGLDLAASPGIDDAKTGKRIADIVDIAGPGVSLGSSCALRHVFLLDGMGEASRLEPLASHAALREILACCFNPTADGAATFARIAPLVSEARCHRLTVGPLDATLDLISKTCTGGAPDGET